MNAITSKSVSGMAIRILVAVQVSMAVEEAEEAVVACQSFQVVLPTVTAVLIIARITVLAIRVREAHTSV